MSPVRRGRCAKSSPAIDSQPRQGVTARAVMQSVHTDPGLSRRQVLQGAVGVGAAAIGVGAGVATAGAAAAATRAGAGSSAHLPPRSQWRHPGSLPDPSLPAGTDTLPEIDHIVVVMQENHSFDNYLGMLGRGDGFTLDRKGRPLNTNPDPTGGYVRAFHETDTSQAGHVTQSWDASHLQYAGGHNNGFIGPESSSDWSMAYYTGEEIPFYYSLARTFPVCDRYFCSVLAQTYPNRRFLLSGTAFGLIATDTSSITGIPPNGTIFDRLNAHGVSWASYATNVSTLYVISDIVKKNPGCIKTIDQFHADARAGSLPAVSYVDPNIFTSTEESPQDISLGEYFVSTVVGSLLNSPAWSKTLLVWTYDEHGGYYDHVPPPAAIPPDDIAPVLTDPSAGRLRPLWLPGSYRGRLAVQQATLRVPHGLRPHVGSQDDRAQVEPPRNDLPGRQRQRPARLPRSQEACLRRSPHLAAPGNTTGIATARRRHPERSRPLPPS